MIGRRMAGRVAAGAALGCLLAFVIAGCRESPDGQVRCEAAVAPIREGFGAPGPHRSVEQSFPNPEWPSMRVVVRLPVEAQRPVPVILFAHAFGTPEPRAYEALLTHITSRGFAVVFSPYMVETTTHADRYAALWSGIAEAARRYPRRLDLGRVGIVGHSYGAGAAPFLGRRALVEEGWGADGAFLLAMAPWYPQGISPEQMRSLPAHLKALIVVFEEDGVTDHRIAMELFHALPLPASEKDYVLFQSDAHGPCKLPAVHTVPQSGGLAARDDALDERGVFRLFDALAAYAFEGDALAQRVALGEGDPAQVFMGHWPDGTPVAPLIVPREPRPVAEEATYLFRYSDAAAWARHGEASPESGDR
jgi:dienelactone hydrolase